MLATIEDAGLCRVAQRGDVCIYRLQQKKLANGYFIISSEPTRKLMASPEVVGYDSYKATVPSTSAVLSLLKEQGEDFGDGVSILTILRGGLNYPVEECCHENGIRVNNIDFLSCERIISDGVITGLDIKYEKFTVEHDCTLVMGDIIASGDTLSHCMEQVAQKIAAAGGSLKKVIFFTIGGTKAVFLLEKLTASFRKLWPGFEGFTCFFYEGIFTVYEDKGVTGVNIPDIDFGWNGGIISPEFRSYITDDANALFEKCIIYDGGARRYEIPAHCEEVTDYWERLAAVADKSDFKAFVEEKIGYGFPISYGDWLKVTGLMGTGKYEDLYRKETDFILRTLKRSLGEICRERLAGFRRNMAAYIK